MSVIFNLLTFIDCMKIKVTQVLKNLDGEEMKFITGKVVDGKEKLEEKPMTLRKVLGELLNTETNEHRLTPEMKNQAGQILLKLWGSDENDLTVEQRAYILKQAEKFSSPLVLVLLRKALEDKDTKVKDK